ncbi:MAG: hypothetical protein ACQESR_14340 [Planctomycetota bacterium]
MGPVELPEWTADNQVLEILAVFGGRFDRKISRQENRVLTKDQLQTTNALPNLQFAATLFSSWLGFDRVIEPLEDLCRARRVIGSRGEVGRVVTW